MSAIDASVRESGSGWRVHLAALAGYFLLALLVTYPVIGQFFSGVPGDLVADRDQNLWNLWWAKESLFRLNYPFHTDLLYYPFGTDLYYHTLGLPLGLIGLVPQLLFGLPAAYNTVLLAGFTLSGYGMFRIADWGFRAGDWGIKDQGSAPGNPQSPIRDPNFLAAFLAGVVFAFTPYTLDALKGQPEVLSLQWMPLFVEMWLRATAAREARNAKRAADTGRWLKYSVLAGVFFALAAYSNLYYAVYLLVFVAVFSLWKLLFGRSRRPATPADQSEIPHVSHITYHVSGSFRNLAPVGLVASGVALVLGLPLLLGLAADRNNPRLAVEADSEHRLAHSADLLSFFTPPHDHLLFGTWQDSPGVKEPPLHDYVGLGYVALGLSILGIVVGWRKPGVKFWVVLGLIALILAMGPELQVGRNRTGIPLPFALLEWLPGMDAIAKPERFVVLSRLCMAILAGIGVAGIANWMRGSRNARRDENLSNTGKNPRSQVPNPQWIWLALLVGLVVELPVHPRYMETVSDLPFYKAYERLAGEPAGGLMELPFATQQSETTGRRMLFQTVHGKPIMGGYLARRYDSPIIDSCGAFWGFISPLDVPREDIAEPLVVNRLSDVLNFFNIRYISVYKDANSTGAGTVDEAQLEAFDEILRQTTSGPVYEDASLQIARVTPREDLPAPRPPDFFGPSFHIGAGWYPVEQPEGQPFRWVNGGRGSLCVFAPEQITASLTLQGTSFAQERGVTLKIGAEQLYEGRLAARAFTAIELPSRTWNAGITQIDIITPEAGTSPVSLDPNAGDKRVLTVGFRGVTLESNR